MVASGSLQDSRLRAVKRSHEQGLSQIICRNCRVSLAHTCAWGAGKTQTADLQQSRVSGLHLEVKSIV